eukprot:c6445_g1_i1.p1 GENE.c6445_g1_i1~~c6445_g1_i1.p1  ORF type:complete len:324 (-),score=93.75 c6445_g1_i1:71-1042(-)
MGFLFQFISGVTMSDRKNDPAWADITPIPQDDGPNPVVPINYSPEFVEVMSYFRAVLKRNEKSQRALDLTSDVIDHNPANYTAWHFRLECLKELGVGVGRLEEELAYVEEMAMDNAKNYQLWHHRKCVIELLGQHVSGDSELAFIARALEQDNKNYHAWGYRQWVVTRYDLWNEELTFTQEMLENDLRNNSAWNQRHWVITAHNMMTPLLLQKEIKFVFGVIDLAPKNPSPWTYLQAVLEHAAEDEIRKVCDRVQVLADKCPHSPAMLAFLADTELRLATTPAQLMSAVQKYETLSVKDPVRAKYWLMQAAQARSRTNSMTHA